MIGLETLGRDSLWVLGGELRKHTILICVYTWLDSQWCDLHCFVIGLNTDNWFQAGLHPVMGGHYTESEEIDASRTR